MLIYCPACRNQLRVQDEFIGRKVRCPMCGSTFEATSELPVSETPADPAGMNPAARSPDYEEIVEYDPSTDPREDEYERSRRPRGRPTEKPGKAQAIAIMTLIGGILAALYSVGLVVGWVVTGFAGMACCCPAGFAGLLWPGQYYSLVLGILAIVKGAALMGRDAHLQSPPHAVAIMQIINIINGDVVNLVLGILTLVFLSEPGIRRYYRG